MISSIPDSERRIAELEAKLVTETAMVNTLRTFIEQGRKEREYLQARQAESEAVIAKLREQLGGAENEKPPGQLQETKKDKTRSETIFLEKQFIAISEKLKYVSTERDSLIAQLKAVKRANADLTEKLKPPPVKISAKKKSPEVDENALFEFEISMKNEEIKNLKNRLALKPKFDFAVQKDFARPKNQDNSVQADSSNRRLLDSKNFRKLKSFLECPCSASAKLLTLLPCGHATCEGCYLKAAAEDKLLRGWPCAACGVIAVAALPATAVERVAQGLKLAEREFSI